MVVTRLFYTPKDVAIIFDMSIRQVYRHAKHRSPGFPEAKRIGVGPRPIVRFDIQETMKCASMWRTEE